MVAAEAESRKDALTELLGEKLAAKYINEAVEKNELIKDEELVIPALSESLEWQRDYSMNWWSSPDS